MTEVKDRDLYTRGDQQMEHRLGAEKAEKPDKDEGRHEECYTGE